MTMTVVKLQVPEAAFAALNVDPAEFSHELRVAAAVKWYELGRLSQERAAELAGLSRSEFISVLSQFQVSPLQYTRDELRQELEDAD